MDPILLISTKFVPPNASGRYRLMDARYTYVFRQDTGADLSDQTSIAMNPDLPWPVGMAFELTLFTNPKRFDLEAKRIATLHFRALVVPHAEQRPTRLLGEAVSGLRMISERRCCPFCGLRMWECEERCETRDARLALRGYLKGDVAVADLFASLDGIRRVGLGE